MLELKVRRIGNSFGIVLPKEALARLKVVEGETLYLTDAENGGGDGTGCKILHADACG